MLAALAFSACARKRVEPERQPAPQPELPAPAGLLAELTVAHPELTWRGLRALGAPVSELLPASFPLLAGTLLGLPALGAGSLDQDVPLRGVVLLNAGTPRGLLALHALDGRELVASLTTGTHPPFRSEREASSQVTFLVPVAATGSSSAVLAVLDSYLLTAPDRQTVLDAGPYVVRTLGKRSPPHGDLAVSIEKKPLHDLLVPALRARWGEYRRELSQLADDARKAHGDRVADFADPQAVLLGSDAQLENLFTLLDGSERVELALDVAGDHCALTLSLTPAASGPAHDFAAALVGSDARSLLRLPDDTLFALGTSRDDSSRSAAVASAGDDWLRVLGDRLSPADAKLVRETLGDWERGRGASAVFGLTLNLDAFGLSGVADQAALERAAPGFLRLLALPGVRQPLSELVGTPSVALAKPRADGVESAVLQFSRSRDKLRQRAELWWRINGGDALAVASPHAESVFAAVDAAARGEHALAGSPALVDAVTRLGAQNSWFGYFDARAFQPDSVSPALFALGKRDGLPALYLELSKPALAVLLGRLKD